MKNNFFKKYLNNNIKIFGYIFMICLIILLIGFSYAFFVYNKTGLYTHTITGGKMSIIYNETTGNNITIDNAYPLTDKEALTKGLEFEFTISGYNESDKNIYYAIEMDYGEDIVDKERFLDSDLKLSLYENDEEVFENEVFNNLDNQDIHYGYINYGTSSESPVTNNYKLRLWINDYVIISDTISNDLSTWTDFEWDFLEEYNSSVYNSLMNSDSQDLSDFGISIYTTEEFANRYANFKVNVKADLTYDDIDFITYDANGGSFTPTKTSLTTNMITVQKPVMENKGFLGWSSKKDATVPEYLAGDYYSGSGQVLYAVYGDTRNVMDYFSETILEHVGELVPPEPMINDNLKSNKLVELESDTESVITQIYFINDTQDNIDARYDAASIKDDLTLNNQGSVKAWLEVDEETISYILYVGAEGTIYLNDCYELFAPFINCYFIDLINIDTSMVTDMSRMFFRYPPVIEPMSFGNGKSKTQFLSVDDNSEDFLIIDSLSSLNTSNVNNMLSMFENCYTLIELNLMSFDTSNVTNMSRMFYECNSLVELNISDLITSNVEEMSEMFSGCYNIEELDLSNFDTTNVKNMYCMFWSCYNLRNLNLNNFNTNQVTSMKGMFDKCSSLTNLNLSSFNTSNVTNMSNMFYYCNELSVLNINSFDTSKVTNMSYMFGECCSLEKINVIHFDTSMVTNMSGMFSGCRLINELDLSNFNTSKVTNMEYMFDMCEEIISVGFDSSYKINISNFDTSNVTDMSLMFYGCKKLVDIEFNGFDLSSIENMTWMFIDCNIKYFDFSNVYIKNYKDVDMSSMFSGCKNLESVNLTNFRCLGTIIFFSIFYDCSNLKYVNFNDSEIESISDMSNMFSSCTSLTTIDLSKLNTSKVTDMSSMFYECESLKEVNLNNWDMSNVTTIDSMFFRCFSLTNLDLSSWVNTGKLDRLSRTSPYGGGGRGAFEECSSLINLDISSFDFSVLIYYTYAFNGMPVDAMVYVKDELARSKIFEIPNTVRPLWSATNILVKTV